MVHNHNSSAFSCLQFLAPQSGPFHEERRFPYFRKVPDNLRQLFSGNRNFNYYFRKIFSMAFPFANSSISLSK